ncbi:3-oxoacyl-ACP synthase III family protein [Nocardia brasiliensis]|uniref:3-oxoacyl-ACP synthase III family protein n=1 Tax=Nocardia brasiliensis TaxID=37326 RepID=UPI003D8D2AD9
MSTKRCTIKLFDIGNNSSRLSNRLRHRYHRFSHMSSARTARNAGPADPEFGFGILGIGMHLPDEVLTNEHFTRTAGVDADWVLTKTGVEQRRRCENGIRTADLAATAGRAALANARIASSPEQDGTPDLLIIATSSPDRQVPAPAFDVHARLGLPISAALSLDGGCAGFGQGLVTAYSYFSAGITKSALVIGAHRSEFLVDDSDRRIGPLFGDGAGAFLLGPVPGGYGILTARMFTDTTHIETLRTPMRDELVGNREYLQMDGRGVAVLFAQQIPRILEESLAAASLTLDRIDHFILHQGNVRMVERFAAALGLRPELVAVSGRVVGNTAAASLPISVVLRQQERPFRRGDIVALITAGAGINGAVVLLRWY